MGNGSPSRSVRVAYQPPEDYETKNQMELLLITRSKHDVTEL